MKKSTVSIILGRKGSKGVPNKNTMNILGQPAYCYPINAAKKSKYVDKIFVSSDDNVILKGSKKLGVSTINRPDHLCKDSSLFEDALIHAYRYIKDVKKIEIDYVVVLMCNAVTINSDLIDNAIKLLNRNPKADSAVTVSIFNMYSPLRARKINKNGYLKPFVPFETFGDPNTLNCDRSSQGDTYFADMSHSVCRAKCLDDIKNGLLPQKWMGNNILPIMNKNGCDIDEPWQIDMSINWLKEKNQL